MNKRGIGRDLGMVGLLTAAVLVFFREAALLQGTFFVQDVMVQNYPFRHFFAQALKEFSLPLWNPAINYGFPLFAEGQAGVLYIFNLLTLFLFPTYAALNYNIIFHIWLAGVGTYGFLRSIDCVRGAALTGALTYACGGFLVVRAMSINYLDGCAWTPVFFLLVELALRRQRWIYLLLAGGVVGLQFLAGHPQATVYSVGAGVLYGLYRGVEQRVGWTFWAMMAVGIPLIGAGLAAVQLIPTTELVWASARSEGVSLESFTSMSLPPERLITFLLPNFFGNSSTGSYWGGREARFFLQLCGYMGVLPLLLALLATRERRDGYTGFFCALCGLSLILVLGRYTAVYEFLYDIPGLKFFRIPTRFLHWLAFGLAILSGLGLDRVLRRNPDKKHLGWWYLCGFLALLAGWMGWLNRDVLIAQPAVLQQHEGQTMVRYQEDLRVDLLRCGLVLGVGGLILVQRGGGRKKRQGMALAAALLVYGDLYSFGREFNALIEPDVYLRTPASAAFILQDADVSAGVGPRLMSLVSEGNSPYDWHSGWARNQDSYRKYPETLRLYTGSVYGLGNVSPGWSPLHLQRHWEFVSGYPAFLSMAGVDYVLSYRPMSYAGLELAREGEVKVYRNKNALPRAYLVEDYQVEADAARRLQYLRSPGFNPRRQVVLEEESQAGYRGSATQGRGEVRMISYRPERVEIELGEHSGGLLVLSDTYYPGWQAYVDGVEQRLLLANHVFRAVEVPEGARQVVFQYKSFSFRLGAWTSAGALGIFAFLLFWSRGRKLERIQPRPAEAKFKIVDWTLQAVLIVVIHALLTQWPLWALAVQRSRALITWGGS